MSNLVEIKKRITSITSIVKVTKVMQMIATAKVAKVKQMIVSANRYNKIAHSILTSYQHNADNREQIKKFMQNNNVNSTTQATKKQILLILLSSDKGTCGSINTNIFKEFSLLVKKYNMENGYVIAYPVGKKAKQYLSKYADKLNIGAINDIQIDAENGNSQAINQLACNLVHMYTSNAFDQINIVYHKFKNIITCNAVCEQILPLTTDAMPTENTEPQDNQFINILESEKTADAIIEFFIRTKLYNIYVSNLASIISSRMNAMDNATKNGQEIIDDLQIKYNKSRQAGITSELSDIVSGFEAIS